MCVCCQIAALNSSAAADRRGDAGDWNKQTCFVLLSWQVSPRSETFWWWGRTRALERAEGWLNTSVTVWHHVVASSSVTNATMMGDLNECQTLITKCLWFTVLPSTGNVQLRASTVNRRKQVQVPHVDDSRSHSNRCFARTELNCPYPWISVTCALCDFDTIGFQKDSSVCRSSAGEWVPAGPE